VIYYLNESFVKSEEIKKKLSGKKIKKIKFQKEGIPTFPTYFAPLDLVTLIN